MKMTIQNAPILHLDSYSGKTAMSILDSLLQNRELICLDEINADSAASLMLQLKHLQEQDPKGEITIYINSPGGSLNDALAIYDVMRASTCPITTVCVGKAASCGAILFAAGDTRKILPHSEVLIHDPFLRGGNGSATYEGLIDNFKMLATCRETVADILAKHSGKSKEEILEKTARETCFTAREAVEFGLADCVIGNIDDAPAQTKESKSEVVSSLEKETKAIPEIAAKETINRKENSNE